MADTTTYRSTLWRRSVSERDTDLLNSTVNLQGNLNLYVPPDRAESNPNISISGFFMNYHIVAQAHVYSRNGREWKRGLTRLYIDFKNLR